MQYYISVSDFVEALDMPQGIMSSTVQLAVGSPTNMLLDVSRDAHSQNYVVAGRLIFSGSGAKSVTLKVNETAYDLTTDSSGHFSKSSDLQPNNNQATSYTISASFSGDFDVKNVTAWSYTLNGTRYAACSTTQYGYGPSSNSTSLVISPLGTEMTTVSVTLVDVKDTLKISTEFSWWYPWLKVVAEVNVPFDIGTTKFRFELMPIVFQQAVYVESGEDALTDTLAKIVATVGPDAAIGIFLGTFITSRIAARVACSSIINVVGVVALYAVVQIGFAFVLHQLFGKTGLAISVISFFLSAVISAFMAGISHISDWVKAIYRGATGQIKDIWHSWWGRDLGFVNIVEATAFFFVDVGLEAFMAGFM